MKNKSKKSKLVSGYLDKTFCQHSGRHVSRFYQVALLETTSFSTT